VSSSALRRLTRPLRHALLCSLIRGLTALLRLTPLSWAQRGGELLGGLVGRLASARLKRRVDQRLCLLMEGEQAREAREELALACWRDLGRRAFEWLLGRRALPLVRLSPEVQAWCDELKLEGSGARWLCLSAHLGHWELMAARLAEEGATFVSAAAGERSGPIGRWISAHRAQLGVQTMTPQASHRALRSFLSDGGVRALLIDQYSRGKATRSLSFLGRPAPTLSLPSRLIERSRALGPTRILWIYCLRDPDGRYCVYGEELSAALDPVLVASARLEALVRAEPAQWLWLNDRWADAEPQPSAPAEGS